GHVRALPMGTDWIEHPIPEGCTGRILRKRVGERVYVRFVNLVMPAGSGLFVLIPQSSLTEGWRPGPAERVVQYVALQGNAVSAQQISIYGPVAWVGSTRPAAGLMGTVSYLTDEPSPA
ncbi:MAG: hypothetical protein Q4F67_14575, partial [Propionibacteriaceae bacterium]|nr:hypothetical protein [Propionibacteriaceae bacterium]